MHIKQKNVHKNWTLFTLMNDSNMEVSVLNYGGIITRVIVPDKEGNMENVVIGYKNYADYEANPNYFGAIIGRVAGRIPNAAFQLDGDKYTLQSNDGSNHLHGGGKGFHQVLWDAETFQTGESVGLTLTHTSRDGEGGYPGEVKAVVTYTLNNQNQFVIDYKAESTKKTILTMTNHSYFNLSGDLKNTIHHHRVTMNSDTIVELDEHLIPTGEKLPVDGTTFDFTSGRELGDGFTSTHPQHKAASGGYDHYFIFEEENKGKVVAAEPDSGRKLTVETNQPGMVMYTSNTLDEGLALTEGESRKYLGLCLETQGSPASLEHEGFPEISLEKGEEYHKQTVFSFDIEN